MNVAWVRPDLPIKQQIIMHISQKGPLKTKELTPLIPYPYRSIMTKCFELRKEGTIKQDEEERWCLIKEVREVMPDIKKLRRVKMPEQTIGQKIMVLLSDGKKSLGIDALVEATGNKKTSVYNACRKLVKGGKLERDADGKWHMKTIITQRSRDLRDRVFGLSSPETDTQKLLDKFGEESFWVSLIQSEISGDLMLCALQSLFDRLSAQSTLLDELMPEVDSLKVQNQALIEEIQNLKEGTRVLRKQRDEALTKSAKQALAR